MEEFLVDDENREAAVAHLAEEHAQGAYDQVELARRTAAVRASRTVAELLAATAPVPDEAPVATRQPVVRNGVVALLAGLLVAVVLGAMLFSRLS